jgi:autotransporter strand-loop-strand O-heptosyltransferase
MITYNLHHVNGLYFEITGDEGKNRAYRCEFIDNADKSKIYETELKVGGYAKLTRQYFSDISVVVRYKERIVTEVNVSKHLKNSRMFISFESSSLGDTLAWIPYCLEFQQKWNCELYVSTFHNYLFESKYPTLKFVPRGAVVNNIMGMFEIGWFYESNREPVKPNLIPLQKAATNILGLEYKELIPDLAYDVLPPPHDKKYVCISVKSTSALKHWDYWQEVIDYLLSKGYDVMEVSNFDAEYTGLTPVADKSLINVMNLIHHCEFFIGLSSGLSWLSWALRKKVVMISNFTEDGHEFMTDCIRITNTEVCHGCWNKEMFRFNKGDWYWCPEHEDTPRQFECHKSIKPDFVLNKLKSEVLAHI